MKKIIILILVMLELSVYFGDNNFEMGNKEKTGLKWEDGKGKYQINVTYANTYEGVWYKNPDIGKTPILLSYILNDVWQSHVETMNIRLKDLKSKGYADKSFVYYSSTCGEMSGVEYYENGEQVGSVSANWQNIEKTKKEFLKRHPDYEKKVTYEGTGGSNYPETYMKSDCAGYTMAVREYDKFTKSQWEARMSEADREEWVYIKNAGVTGVGASLDHHLRIRALYLFRDNVVRRKAFKNSVCNWIDEDVIYDEKGNEVKRYSYDHVGGELKITDGGKVVKEKINKKVCEGMAERPADNRINSLVKSFFDMNKKYNIKTYKSITSEEEFEYKP